MPLVHCTVLDKGRGPVSGTAVNEEVLTLLTIWRPEQQGLEGTESCRKSRASASGSPRPGLPVSREGATAKTEQSSWCVGAGVTHRGSRRPGAPRLPGRRGPFFLAGCTSGLPCPSFCGLSWRRPGEQGWWGLCVRPRFTRRCELPSLHFVACPSVGSVFSPRELLVQRLSLHTDYRRLIQW